MNRYASIDIGTNTVLMVIADVTEDGILIPVSDDQRSPRLGKGVDADGLISHESVRRVLNTLREYKKKAESLNASEIFACGTSALRDALNRDEVVRHIKQEVNIHVDIISGEQEAEYTYLGAISGLTLPPGITGVLDIGGGSTELVIGNRHSMTSRWSIDVGCVRLTERYFTPLPPSAGKLNEAIAYVKNIISEITREYKVNKLIGVAGTVTTLAAIDRKLTTFSAELIEDHILSKDKIESIFHTYSRYNIEEMKSVPQITPGREDILLAGIAILRAYLEILGQESITVSTRGLRYGQILARIER